MILAESSRQGSDLEGRLMSIPDPALTASWGKSVNWQTYWDT